MSRTRRHIEYASGYLALRMLDEAAEELEKIGFEDRLNADVLAARSDLYMEAKQWDLVIAVSKELARQQPKTEKGWINWAYALREMQRVKEAKLVLLEAQLLLVKPPRSSITTWLATILFWATKIGRASCRERV